MMIDGWTDDSGVLQMDDSGVFTWPHVPEEWTSCRWEVYILRTKLVIYANFTRDASHREAYCCMVH